MGCRHPLGVSDANPWGVTAAPPPLCANWKLTVLDCDWTNFANGDLQMPDLVCRISSSGPCIFHTSKDKKTSLARFCVNCKMDQKPNRIINPETPCPTLEVFRWMTNIARFCDRIHSSGVSSSGVCDLVNRSWQASSPIHAFLYMHAKYKFSRISRKISLHSDSIIDPRKMKCLSFFSNRIECDLNKIWILINYDGGVSDQLGLTEGYQARTRLGNPAVQYFINFY